MKKILGISVVALFAAMPTIAGAANMANAPTVVKADEKLATVSYVIGAYDAAKAAVNTKQDEIEDLTTIRSGAAAGATALQAAGTGLTTDGKTVLLSTDTQSALTKANSALQKADITIGSDNGTISVGGTDVAVKGLGTAAYTDSSAYDVSGAASTAKGEIEGKFASGTAGYDINAKSLKVQNAAVLTENSALDGAKLTDSTVTLDKLESSVQSALDKAGTALQASDITTGTTSGTIKVGNADVTVNGLGSAAFSGVATSIASGATGLATAQQVYDATKDKADAATSLAGYGITDAYTSTAADNKFATQSGVAATINAVTYAGTLADSGVTGTVTAMASWGDSVTTTNIPLQGGVVKSASVTVARNGDAAYTAN